ncbi:MAG: DUF3422 domain-containing protein [Pseudomonadota bacterium]
MIELPQHSARGPLTDELHARPFMPIRAPSQAVSLALVAESGGATRDPRDDLAHLNALLSHLGASPCMADGDRVPNFYIGEFESFQLKWERHTEFVTYMIAPKEGSGAPFEPLIDGLTPPGWLEDSPLRAIAACAVDIVSAADEAEAERIAIEELAPHFNRNSLAVTWVTERAAIALGDFRIDQNGYTRFGVVALDGQIGARRLGRVVQRLIEMEVYRVMAMKALPVARALNPELSLIEARLAEVARDIAAADDNGGPDPQDDRRILTTLTALSADLEKVSAENAYRFSASRAYETIVSDRISAIREERLRSRQTFDEFMMRRFLPAVRTIRSADQRMAELAARGERAANLLRTRIDVSLQAQNQRLLQSMNDRARLQLRLQQTVEGLSVVAISYYAVSLSEYFLKPIFEDNVEIAMAVVAIPIVAGVFTLVRRVRMKIENKQKK